MTKKEITRIAKEFRQGFLSGKPSSKMCYAVSAALGGYLSFAGVKVYITKGVIGEWEHFWLTLEDDMIIDATADQFKSPDGKPMPPVYIGAKPEWYVVEVPVAL